MKIKINHLAKMEGHMDFEGALMKGNVGQAKLITTEGIRLMEGIVVGRNYTQVPVITARICGICPVVHALTAINAIEDALGIKVSVQTTKLRKIMELAQILHSHALHLYFLSLPDFFGIENDLEFLKQFPKAGKSALNLREWATNVIKILGARVVHPIACEVGGFKILPKEKQLEEIYFNWEKAMFDAIELVLFTANIKYPSFVRKTEFISLHNKNEYAIYSGNLNTSSGEKISTKNITNAIYEYQLPNLAAKRAKYKDKPFMVGALARLNNNHEQLAPQAKKAVADLTLEFPIHNTFFNVLAQAIEVLHCTEEIGHLIRDILKVGLKDEVSQAKKLKLIAFANPKNKTTKGSALMEAPRGILYHHYEIDRDGRIVSTQIITPTVLFLNNIEEDLRKLLPQTAEMSPKERELKIKTLIRAYDPCISCATH
ncbi:Ni/Fe hydrogenase subunit alpha [Patescibacteria group bacterium]|nr:Ni/Fe hydrogenase subunit alpha [Patescibacteria group bacterium]